MNPSSVNNFFGQKLSSQGVNVSGAGDKQLLWKDDYDANLKTWYGTNGPIMEQGKLTQNPDSYGLEIVNPSNGKPIANYGEQTDGTVNLKFFDSNGVGVAQFGQFPDGSIALKVAESGVEVSTATGNQLIFNSNQNIFKIVQTGTVTIPGTGNQAPFATGAEGITVPHNLGYPPAYLCYAFLPVVPVSGQPPVTNWNQLLPAVASDSNQMVYNVQAGTDSTNLYLVDFWANNGNITPVQAINVTYYLYTQSAQ